MAKDGKPKEAHPGPRKRPGALPLLARTGRFRIVIAGILFAFGCLAVRLWWLQYYRPDELRSSAEKAREFSSVFRAERGQIRDAHDTILAKSREVWDIGVDPVFLEQEKADPKKAVDPARVAEELSHIIKVPASRLLAIFNHRIRDDGENAGGAADDNSDEDVGSAAVEPGAKKVRLIRWTPLVKGVDQATRDAVDAKMAAMHVRAVRSDSRYEREYPFGKLASQLVGYVNREGRPTMGVERAFDFFLKGSAGWIDTERDGKRHQAADKQIREVRPRDGCNVILTLDATIQQLVEEELGKACEAYHPEWGIVIVSEAKTGRLLALTNWPTFDLNNFSDLKASPLEAQKNRAVTDIYEPGSVFKIVSYSAAIEEGVVTLDTTFDCGANRHALLMVPYKGKMYKLPDDDEDLGTVDVRKGIAKSSNRVAAQIAMRVAEIKGEDRLWRYMSDFGFGSRTGLVTGSEVRGLLLKPSEWQWSVKAATITQVPMGHSVSVTALQTHYAMGVIASGGVLFTPRLVDRVVDRAGGTVVDFPPVIRKRAVSTGTAKTIAGLLHGVVTDGTGKKAAIPGYDVAGKTGTTEMLVKNPATGRVEYSKSKNVASFCGFFPAGNPQIVISVIMADPHGNGRSFGGTYSAPLFKSIALGIIKYLRIPPHDQAEFDAGEDRRRKKAGLPPLKRDAPPVSPLPVPAFPFGNL